MSMREYPDLESLAHFPIFLRADILEKKLEKSIKEGEKLREEIKELANGIDSLKKVLYTQYDYDTMGWYCPLCHAYLQDDGINDLDKDFKHKEGCLMEGEDD